MSNLRRGANVYDPTGCVRRPAVLLLALLCTTAVFAQRASETIEISIINVDVHVTDKNGKPVRGLTANDFEIREDGRPQPITNFSEYASAPVQAAPAVTAAPTAASAAPVATPPTPRRTIVFFLEPVTMPAPRAKEVFDSIRSLMHSSVRPGDRASIVTWQNGIRVRQQLTDQLPALDQMMTVIEKEFVDTPNVDVGEVIRHQQQKTDYVNAEFDSAVGATGAAASTVKSDALPAAQRQMRDIKQKMLAVRALMESISGIEGPKVLVMATKRLGSFAGAEYFGGEVPRTFRQELDTKKLRDSLTSVANAKGITVYPFFLEGLGTTSNVDAAHRDQGAMARDSTILMNETTALQEIASETGGLTGFGAKDVSNIVSRIGEGLDTYYSLGYRARPTGRDSAHRIVVTTKNPDYVVRSRRAAVEVSDASRMQDRVVANLFQNVDGATIKFDVVIRPLEAAGNNRWTTTLVIRIPIANLMTLKDAKGESGSFSVFVGTGSSLGSLGDVAQRTQAFSIAEADLERARASHYTYEFALEVDEVMDRVSVGVLDDVSKEFGLKRFALPKR